MSNADVLPNESSEFSTPHSRHISAYSQEDGFEAVVPVVDQYIDHDISPPHTKTIPLDDFLRGLGAESEVIGGGDTKLKGIAESREVLDLRDKYCAEMDGEVQRYGPFCNLANHIIEQIEGSKIRFVRNDPKIIEGVCKSRRKPDIIGIGAGHENVADGLWKKYNKRGPPVNTSTSQTDEGVREVADRKGKGGKEKKVAKRFVPWGWKDIQYVAEFKKHAGRIDFTRTAVGSHALRTKRKSRGGKATSRPESSETKGQTSSPHTMTQSGSSSKAASRESGKRKLLEELQEEDGRGDSKRPRQSTNTNTSEVRYDLQLGGARYAVDQLSALTHRRHVIELLVIDGVLTLAYYDRGGPVYSKDLHFVHDLYRFCLLMKLLATMNSWQRGFLEKLIDVTSSSIGGGSPPALLSEEDTKGQDLDAKTSVMDTSPSGELERSDQIHMNEVLEDGPEVVPPPTPPIESQQSAEDTVPDRGEGQSKAASLPTARPPDPVIEPPLGHHRYNLILPDHTVRLYNLCGKRPPYGLISRGSSVFLSKCETLDRAAPNRVYATKISWPLARRRSEAVILEEGRGILSELDSKSGQKEKYGYGKRKLEDCLPKIYKAEEIDDILKENSFRWRIAQFLGDEFNPVNRICRVIVMERLQPLRHVKSVALFKQAIRDVVLAHHLLFTSELQILHRDISADNLMVRYNEDGTICGVLIDFDLAVKSSEITEDHTGTRTGTRPFMAWELLSSNPPPVHLERFDWESFFYVISWIGCRYSEGKEVNKSALPNWYNPDDATLQSVKRDWLSGREIAPFFTPFYESVALDWAFPLQMMFKSGNDARIPYSAGAARAMRRGRLKEKFDEVTNDGHVTWDRFWEILQN